MDDLAVVDGHELNEVAEEKAFFTVSTSKFSKLYVLTFGFYGLYWFYKNWRMQKDAHGLKVMPVPRAIFSIFFTHSLFHRIDDQVQNREITSTFKPALMATLYVVLMVVSNVLSNIGALPEFPNYLQLLWIVGLVFSVYPLQEAQDAINQINDDPFGHANSRYSWKNILAMILGAAFWLVSLLGSVVILFGQPA